MTPEEMKALQERIAEALRRSTEAQFDEVQALPFEPPELHPMIVFHDYASHTDVYIEVGLA
jgi:hypothetical protein